MRHGRLWHGMWDHQPTETPDPNGRGVLLETDEGKQAHFALVGKGHRVVQDIGTIAIDPSLPNASEPGFGYAGGITYSAITSDYIAFSYHPLNGDYGSDVWRIYLFDRRAHKLKLVATNPVDEQGHPLQSGYVEPKLTSRYLYWIESWAKGSELMQYTLGTGRLRMLYRGVVTAFVPYTSSQLLYIASATRSDPAATVQMIDQVTGRSEPAPIGITAAANNPVAIVSNGDMVVWNGDPGGVLRAWRPAWRRSITLVPAPVGWPLGRRLQMSGASYPRIYGHFLVFESGGVFVLDLTTDTFAQLIPESHVGQDKMSAGMLSIEAYTNRTKGNVVTPKIQYDQYLFSLRGLPDLPRCGH